MIKINGEDMEAPVYVNFDCVCGNHFELKAVYGWKIGIRGLSALRLTCMQCGTVVGDEEYELPKPVETEFTEVENVVVEDGKDEFS